MLGFTQNFFSLRKLLVILSAAGNSLQPVCCGPNDNVLHESAPSAGLQSEALTQGSFDLSETHCEIKPHHYSYMQYPFYSARTRYNN